MCFLAVRILSIVYIYLCINLIEIYVKEVITFFFLNQNISQKNIRNAEEIIYTNCHFTLKKKSMGLLDESITSLGCRFHYAPLTIPFM